MARPRSVSPHLVWTLALLACGLRCAAGFYLPGVAPRDFMKDDKASFKVNKLSSTKTQLPYDYYSLPYCRPQKIRSIAENLGEVLRGDRIETSVFEFEFLKEQWCTVACRQPLKEDDVKNFASKIEDDYRVNMIFDNLPVGILRELRTVDENGKFLSVYDRGYPVGFKEEDQYILNNHLRFIVHYHMDPATSMSRVVGFEVTPYSVHHVPESDDKVPRLSTCDAEHPPQVFNAPKQQVLEEEVIFTYDILFKDSDVRWASRWDSYLAFQRNDQVHWFSIINSLMIVIFLSGMVAMIMLRTLHRDIMKYNQLETVEEAQEESGWKLVHGDVFRPPSNASWLAVHVGVGIQLFGMLLVAISFALLGFLSPANRGSLMTAILVLFVFMGFFAGFYSARLYKTVKGTHWKLTTVRTAFFFPGVCFAVFFILNLLIWGQKSSGAVPFGTLFTLCCLWFGISAPLVFVGSYLGFKKTPADDPVRTNKIPRQIPEQPFYMHPTLSCLIGGLLPFGAVFIELFFILTSIWLHQFYYIFGFLTLVFLILICTCAEITIVLCYFQLCSEDYHWWWRSFFTAGSSALYLFLYSAYYFYTKLDISKAVSAMLYFGYMGILSYGFFCMTGMVGFYACHWFVHKIYSAVKFD